MKPAEHYSEALRLAVTAEARRRQPHQPFDMEPWLKALVHATLALYRPEPAEPAITQLFKGLVDAGQAANAFQDEANARKEPP
jgi:hypothetical protein